MTWIARVGLGVLVIATVLPLLPKGTWFVRLCDFPRVQLATLSLLPLAYGGYLCLTRGQRMEGSILLAVSTLVAVWQLSHVLPFTPLSGKELLTKRSESEPDIRIVVANIQFDNPSKPEVLNALKAQQPDVLLLIEPDELWQHALEPLRQEFEHRCEVYRGEGLGIVLWSRFPLSDAQVRHLISNQRASLHAQVNLPGGDSFGFVGVHPTPPGLQDSTQGGRRDSRVRDAELVVVAKEIADHPDSTWVVTGDFNDVAWSHTTRLFKRVSGLHDPRVGRKLLNTYHSQYPLLRYPIDHVFLSQDWKILRLTRFEVPGSDHFGLVADLSLSVASEEASPHPSQEDRREAEELIDEGLQDAEQRGVATVTP